MSKSTNKTYWKSLAQRDGLPIVDPPAVYQADPGALNRRHFLEAAGFTLSLTALSGCGRAPAVTALPFTDQPEGVIPGRTQQYASTCGGCSAGCGLLVGVRDGRPLKMEGLREHPLSRGGLCPIGQALPLGLYDSQRLQTPLADGQAANWKHVDTAVVARLREIDSRGGKIRFVTPTVTSPTLQASIDSFLAQFQHARHVLFDAVSSSAILDAHQKTHQTRVLPHYQLDRAKVIVALGADFLGSWISPVEFTAAWQTRRSPSEQHPEMSYHAQLEGRLSLTGANADRRFRVSPADFGSVLNDLARRIAKLAKHAAPVGTPEAVPVAEQDLGDLSERLWHARGECIVLCDSQDVAVQMLVNFVNHLLGNYGRTLDLAYPSRQRQARDAELLELVGEVEAGQIDALFVAGTDLTHNLPGREAVAEAIANVPLVVSFAERVDDFASLADFVCPDHHALESWQDAEPVQGLISLSQPTLRPIGKTRSILESLARWSGKHDSAYNLLRGVWKKEIYPQVDVQPFQTFWDQALHDGFVDLRGIRSSSSGSQPANNVPSFAAEEIQLVEQPTAAEGFTLALYSKVGLTDSRHAHNPWLQELPDPITKLTWDNYVSISPAAAERLALVDGDLVRVETADGQDRVVLPVVVQPGQHDQVLAIALGYGVSGTDRFANIGPSWIEAQPTVAPGELVGKNAASFIDVQSGTLRYTRAGVQLVKTGGRRALASTQDHHSLEVPSHVAPHGAEMRDAVQETTLPAFAGDAGAGAPHAHDFGDKQLWAEDHLKHRHHWGLVVDLNKCTGCSACLIACQAENNVPVVGKDEVRRQREMHWIRVDRYYSGHDDDLQVAHQPMMCHHCDNAPCETVCPVLATVHGDGGLNEQAYNRCVGTRYCANNCPYKVRRFNWFKYERDDPLQNLALNPDVTVRTRGVMEKCSMCVQRIEEGKVTARARGAAVADGAIQTACQQSCPSKAIVFGDMNDQHSQVHAALENPRQYRALAEFNFRPSVAYLRMVRNRDDQHGEDGHHG